MTNITLKLIFRSWWRNKLFAVISLLSLTVGIACTNLLITYVIYEAGIEADNPNKPRIVYMAQDSPLASGEQVSFIVGDIPTRLKAEYPEVEDYLRMSVTDDPFILIGENKFDPITILSADPSLPRFFPYETVAGDLERALSTPGMIALTETQARRFFGSEDPIGQVLRTQSTYTRGDKTYEVAAVVKEYPRAYLDFDALVGADDSFNGGVTLLLVNDRFDRESFAEKLKADKVPTFQGEVGRYYFYTLQESYFQDETYTQEYIPYIHRNQKDLLYVGLFSAILILAIACFNYVNLSFTRVLQQVKMIYTQKMMGASPGEIRRQLFLDTFLTVCAAFLLSLPLMLDFLPTFNRMMSGRVSIGFFLSGAVLPVILLFILALSVIPALYMSQRIAALSHAGYRELASGGRKQRLITALSIAQFAISIGLVFATITVRGQLSLTRANGDRYRGLIEVTDWSGEHIQAFAQEISGDPAIEEMSLAKGALFNFMLRQLILKDEQGNERYYTLAQFAGDSTFLRITRQRVLRGMSEREALQRYAMPVYINERYAEVLVPKGENPVGKPVRMYDAEFGKNDMGLEKKGADSQAIIAGVIENLYTGTLRQEVHPALTYLNSKEPDHVALLRVRDEGKAETIDRIRAAWEKVNPNEPVIYQDLYEEFMRMNQKTIQLAELLTLYSVISLVLTASGLFGMALYAIERRTKEIGIRKVNGASTGEILRMLNLRFVGWVGVAFVIAIPVTWYFLGEWLKSFVYRIDVSPWTALLSGCAVLLVTLLTVSGHSYRAATRNPVKALRSE